MEFKTPREDAIFTAAVYFTAVRGVLSNRVRHECGSFEEAEEIALQYGDGRTMIYAIDETGGCAHICNR